MMKFVSAVILLFATSALSAQTAQQNFQQKCSICHGQDGKSQTSMGKTLGAPDLTSEKIQKMSDAELKTVITSGKGKMPAYGPSLGGEKGVSAVLQYVRGLKK